MFLAQILESATYDMCTIGRIWIKTQHITLISARKRSASGPYEKGNTSWHMGGIDSVRLSMKGSEEFSNFTKMKRSLFFFHINLYFIHLMSIVNPLGPGYRAAYDIFTGKAILSKFLLDKFDEATFQYPFWAKSADLEHFLTSPAMNARGIKLLPNSVPFKAESLFVGDRWYYNISQTTDPFALFDYFLYRRHFLCSKQTFHFQSQCLLEAHAKNLGFESRHWITKKILNKLCDSHFYIKDESVCAPKGIHHEKVFNIMQTNKPSEIMHRLQNIPRSMLGGKSFPRAWWGRLYKCQIRNNYVYSVWCHEDTVKFTALALKSDAYGVYVVSDDHQIEKKLYNIDEFIDPLAAFKLFSSERKIFFANSDVFLERSFSRNDVARLEKFKNVTGFRSRFWIRSLDMKRVGATCIVGQAGCTALCANSEWYNMQQIRNHFQVLRDIYNLKKKCKQSRSAPEPLSIFDEIIENPPYIEKM